MWEKADGERLRELAQFLRTRRARMTPEQAGLPTEGRRRTPGLRRSEVALLAGISVDWYTWLEQGRNIQVSSQVLESIARALQLDADEKKHLFLLALQQYPAVSGEAAAEITPALQRFLDLQGTSPAYVTDQRLNIVGWNRIASIIYGEYETMLKQGNATPSGVRLPPRMSAACSRNVGKPMPGTVWRNFGQTTPNSPGIHGGRT